MTTQNEKWQELAYTMFKEQFGTRIYTGNIVCNSSKFHDAKLDLKLPFIPYCLASKKIKTDGEFKTFVKEVYDRIEDHVGKVETLAVREYPRITIDKSDDDTVRLYTRLAVLHGSLNRYDTVISDSNRVVL